MKGQKLDIYHHKKEALQRELIKLDKENISHKNKELIGKFQDYLFSINTSETRVTKLSYQMRKICVWSEKALKIERDLDSWNREDFVRLVSLINKSVAYKPATKSDYRRLVKQFFRWMKRDDARLYSNDSVEKMTAKKFYDYLKDEIKIRYKKEEIDPQTIITDEDIAIVIERGCRTAREKAFISLLHETGMRVGEFLNLRVGDIKVKEDYGEVSVPQGKTGRRQIYIVKSLPYVIQHIGLHPFKNNDLAYLWLSEAMNNRDEPILHQGGQKIIHRCFERAGITKRCNYHWFRHSRASLLSPKITEAMLCKYMGWSLGSRQVQTYTHLSNHQLEDVFLSINNIKSKAENNVQPVKCSCGSLNQPNQRYCYRCHRPLSVEVTLQDKELANSEINKSIQFMMEIAKNPAMLREFEEFKKKMQG